MLPAWYSVRLTTSCPTLSMTRRTWWGRSAVVVARAGERGSTLFTTRGELKTRSSTVPVVDTVGAGDAFDSGFIAAAMAGRGLRECMAWGNACGNHSVQSAGGHSCPDRAALEALLERAGYVLVDERSG